MSKQILFYRNSAGKSEKSPREITNFQIPLMPLTLSKAINDLKGLNVTANYKVCLHLYQKKMIYFGHVLKTVGTYTNMIDYTTNKKSFRINF